ncbi:MAG TPA: TlpA family protein disulfide reductase [Rikenellaceae bacterium]|nr:TlpA family protein disulfide reductase [Rikenellaceae bacterium]
MRSIITLFSIPVSIYIILLSLSSCKNSGSGSEGSEHSMVSTNAEFNQGKAESTNNENFSEDINIKLVNFEQLKPAYINNDDVLYVVNFWATWCGPCVKELPHFMEVYEEFKSNKKFKMILVSLDDSDNLETAVKSFIVRMNLKGEIYLLDDIKKMNEWIPAVNKDWSGSIPATLVIKNGQTLSFDSRELSKNELIERIEKYL